MTDTASIDIPARSKGKDAQPRVRVAPPRAPAIAADGEVVGGDELEGAVELTRLPRRLGLRRVPVDGFALYRLYRALARAGLAAGDRLDAAKTLYGRTRWRVRRLRRWLRGAAPLPGARPWASQQALNALRSGDHARAQELAARSRQAHPKDPWAAYVEAAARWEQESGDAVVEEIELRARPGATDGELEAAVRFFRHIEDLPRAAECLRPMRDPSPSLLREIARALQSRGHCELARESSARALALDPGSDEAASVQERAIGTLSVLNQSRAPGGSARPDLDSIPGRIMHMLERSLPHHLSGGTVRSHNLIRAQREAGIDAHAATQVGFPWTAGASGAEARELVDDVPYHHRPSPNGIPDRLDRKIEANIEAASDLAELVRPSILHPASDYVNALTALELRERFGIPVVYEVRGFPEERLVGRPGSRAMMDPHVARRELELRCWIEADRLVTLAEVMKDHIVSRGVAAEKITVVPNAVDPDAFAPGPRDPALADRFAIEPAETVLGYVSTLNRYEGLEHLIVATAKLRERGHRVRALIVGDGNSRGDLERLAAELGISGQVTFAGRVAHAEIPGAYRAIDVFVVPRTDEATCQLVMPLKPYEAMAAARPVVVSGTRVLRELILDGEIGLAFEPEDAGSLADVVEPLIGDPDRRAELGARAREWVASERTWRGNAQRYRSLYEDIAELD